MKYRKIMIFPLFLLSLCFGSEVFATEYKVAVRAHHGIADAEAHWQATLDFLSQNHPGDKFTLVPIVSLNALSSRTGKNEFHFVLTNPSSYVEIKQRYGAYALATLNNKRANTAQSRFGSVIFTHARNTHIVSLHDLKNKTLMAVSKPAFGGWQVAWLEMLKQGFNPERELKALRFAKTKTQPEVVQAVLHGEVDAGVVRTDLLERLEAKNKIDMRYLRILNNKDIKTFPFFLSTDLYPEWAFAATQKTPERLANSVRKHLLSIKKDNIAAISGQYIGWKTPDSYQSVKQLMTTLRVGPYAANKRNSTQNTKNLEKQY